MSTYPAEDVQSAANRLMSVLALHEDARGTVTDALADMYEAGRDSALTAAADLNTISEAAAAAISGERNRLAALHHIRLTADRIAAALNPVGADHATEDTSCRVCGDPGRPVDDGTGKPYGLCDEDDQAHAAVREGIARIKAWNTQPAAYGDSDGGRHR